MENRKQSRPKLTEKESEIMHKLWEHGALTVREMLCLYDEPRPHFNTISTLTRILVQKGYVEHRGMRKGAFLYAPVVEASFFRRESVAGIVRNFFGNSYKSVVSSFIEEEKLSVDDLREIIKMVESENIKKG